MEYFVFLLFNFRCMKGIIFIATVAFSLYTTAISAQEIPTPQPISGEVIDEGTTVYRIFVGTISENESLSQFNDLTSLGFVQSFPLTEISATEGVTRASREKKVYLGPFLGRETVTGLLPKVLQKGYVEAFVEMDDQMLKKSIKDQQELTVQLGAFKNLDLRSFVGMDNIPAHGMYIKYEDGFYKVFAGIYGVDQTHHIEKTVMPYFKKRGFDGFMRPFLRPHVVVK